MIDPSDIALLSKEDQTELRNFEIMLASPAWLEVVRGLEAAVEQAKAAMITAPNWDQVLFNRGAAAAYTDVINTRDRVAAHMEAKVAAVKDAKEVEDADAELEYE